MIVKKVSLENFMRYENQEVELAPGFNAFVGQTDAGKSTVLRALVWVMYNRPTGAEMCRFGTDQTTVTITIEDSLQNIHTISRVRSKKRNAYCLDGQWYDNVKTEVPQEVQNVLGVQLAELGPKVFEMLNVSRQLDGPFMLSGSGTDAAKMLGNLAGITKLDIAIASLRPDITKATNELQAYDKIETRYGVSSLEFEHLEKETEELASIRLDLQKAQELGTRVERLRDLYTKMDLYNSTVATIDDKIAEQNSIYSNRPLLEVAATTYESLYSMRQLYTMMAECNEAQYDWTRSDQSIRSRIRELEDQYAQTLSEAGQCPTCGKTI